MGIYCLSFVWDENIIWVIFRVCCLRMLVVKFERGIPELVNTWVVKYTMNIVIITFMTANLFQFIDVFFLTHFSLCWICWCIAQFLMLLIPCILLSNLLITLTHPAFNYFFSLFVFIFYMQSILTPANIANEPTIQSSRTSSHLQ